jgi:hypothetical protein
MMELNTHTYEAYLLDYSEGQLSDQEVLLLKQFIDAHPELGSWEEFTGKLPVLAAEELSFDNKDLLRQNPDFTLSSAAGIECFDHTAINYLEGELSKAEQKQFEAALAENEALLIEFELLKRTYLKNDDEVVYPYKSDLKKAAVGFYMLKNNYWMGVAAGLLLLLSAGWWFLRAPVPIQMRSQQLLSMRSKAFTETLVSSQIKPQQTIVHRSVTFPDYSRPSQDEAALPDALPVMPLLKSETIYWTAIGQILYDDQWQTMHFYFNGEAYLARIEGRQERGKSLAGLILANTGRKLLSVFRKENAEQNLEEESAEQGVYAQDQLNERFTAIRWAEAGVKTFNLLTDNEVELKKIADDNGRIKALHFQSQAVSIRKSLDKKEDSD